MASEVSSEALAVLAAHAGCALNRSIQRLVLASDQNLGHLEAQAAQDVQELLRQTMERGAQAKAEATPPLCPVCGQALSRVSGNHARTFQSRFGAITVRRTRGYCKRCRKWRVPADTALGLEETAGYSPAVQDMAALLVSKMPVEDARAVLEHLTGVQLPRATLDREARRQGERAQRLRAQLDQQASTEKRQCEHPARREGLGEGADITWGSGGGWSGGRRQQASRAGHLLDGGLHVRGLDSLSAGAGGLDPGGSAKQAQPRAVFVPGNLVARD